MKIVAVVSLSAQDMAKVDWQKVLGGDLSEVIKKVNIESVRIE